jgi:hypothetical protein
MPPTGTSKQWPLKLVKVIYVLTALAVFVQVLVGSVLSLPQKIISGPPGAPDLIQWIALPSALLFLYFGFGATYRTRRVRKAAALFSAAFTLLMAAQIIRLMGGQHYTWHPHIEITVSAAFIVSQMFALASLLCVVEEESLG